MTNIILLCHVTTRLKPGNGIQSIGYVCSSVTGLCEAARLYRYWRWLHRAMMIFLECLSTSSYMRPDHRAPGSSGSQSASPRHAQRLIAVIMLTLGVHHTVELLLRETGCEGLSTVMSYTILLCTYRCIFTRDNSSSNVMLFNKERDRFVLL